MVLKNYPNLSNQDSEFIFILRYYIFIEGQVFDDDFGLGGREGGRERGLVARFPSQHRTSWNH